MKRILSAVSTKYSTIPKSKETKKEETIEKSSPEKERKSHTKFYTLPRSSANIGVF
jgi:hypothetical protein